MPLNILTQVFNLSFKNDQNGRHLFFQKITDKLIEHIPVHIVRQITVDRNGTFAFFVTVFNNRPAEI